MTPDQRVEHVQQPKLSSQIKGSIQQQSEEQFVHRTHSPSSTVQQTDGRQGFYQSKVTKDSLVYSAGDEEKVPPLQKSTLSGLSEEQLSAHLISDEKYLLKHPVSRSTVGENRIIQIQDFGRPQDISTMIIQGSVPQQEVKGPVLPSETYSFKKSSKRLSPTEAALHDAPDIPLASDQLRQSNSKANFLNIQEHHQSVQHTSVSETTQQRSLSSQISQNAEVAVPQLPLTAMGGHGQPGPKPHQMISSTGQSTPNNPPLSSDRAIRQYEPLVQLPPQQTQQVVKTTTSSLLAHRQQASQAPKENVTVELPSQRVSSSTGTQLSKPPQAPSKPNPPHHGQGEVSESLRTNKPAGQQVLALRQSRDAQPSQQQTDSNPTLVTRTVAATPQVLEYMRTHQGQLPQDTVITHPPKVVAEYTLDAQGKRVPLPNQGQQTDRSSQSQSSPQPTARLPIQTQTVGPRVSERVQQQLTGVVTRETRAPPQSSPAREPLPQFGEARMHQINEEVVIENKPYIIDPRTGKKVYVDPQNLGQYVTLFKQAQGSPAGTQQQQQQQVNKRVEEQEQSIPNLSPKTRVVNVPRPQPHADQPVHQVQQSRGRSHAQGSQQQQRVSRFVLT